MKNVLTINRMKVELQAEYGQDQQREITQCSPDPKKDSTTFYAQVPEYRETSAYRWV